MLGFFEECFREHGDAAYFRLANRRSMLLSHPDDIERVLVTENRRFIKNYALIFLRPLLGNGLLLNEGQSWLRQRRLIQPAFAKPRVEGYAPAMVECTARLLDRWHDGQTLDIAAGDDGADDVDRRADAAWASTWATSSTKSKQCLEVTQCTIFWPASAPPGRCPSGCRRR